MFLQPSAERGRLTRRSTLDPALQAQVDELRKEIAELQAALAKMTSTNATQEHEMATIRQELDAARLRLQDEENLKIERDGLNVSTHLSDTILHPPLTPHSSPLPYIHFMHTRSCDKTDRKLLC